MPVDLDSNLLPSRWLILERLGTKGVSILPLFFMNGRFIRFLKTSNWIYYKRFTVANRQPSTTITTTKLCQETFRPLLLLWNEKKGKLESPKYVSHSSNVLPLQKVLSFLGLQDGFYTLIYPLRLYSMKVSDWGTTLTLGPRTQLSPKG